MALTTSFIDPQALGVKGHTSHLIALFFFLTLLVQSTFDSCLLLVSSLHTDIILAVFTIWLKVGRWACFFSRLIFSTDLCLSPCLSAPASFLLFNTKRRTLCNLYECNNLILHIRCAVLDTDQQQILC